MKEIIDYCEEAYQVYGRHQRGETQANFSPMVSFPTKTPHTDVDYRAGTIDPIPTICTTLGWGFWDNPKNNGLPSVWEVVCLNDIKTGQPLCIMHGYYLGGARTGAAGGVCSKFLAKKDSTSLGLVGVGTVGLYMLWSHLELFKDIDVIKAWSRTGERREKFAKEYSKKFDKKIVPVESVREAVEGIDIVCAAVPSREPVIRDAWVKKGTHINAFGADGKGKQELDPEILKRADKIVVDNMEQCRVGGEVNVPLSQGLLRESDVYGQIGEIVNGWKKGRESDAELTVMDSTGLSILDVVCNHRAFEKAVAKGIGTKLTL
jgi:alanine dehydrogenase